MFYTLKNDDWVKFFMVDGNHSRNHYSTHKLILNKKQEHIIYAHRLGTLYNDTIYMFLKEIEIFFFLIF